MVESVWFLVLFLFFSKRYKILYHYAMLSFLWGYSSAPMCKIDCVNVQHNYVDMQDIIVLTCDLLIFMFTCSIIMLTWTITISTCEKIKSHVHTHLSCIACWPNLSCMWGGGAESHVYATIYICNKQKRYISLKVSLMKIFCEMRSYTKPLDWYINYFTSHWQYFNYITTEVISNS